MTREYLSSAEARRIALRASGIGGKPLGRPVRAEDLRRVIRNLGLVQLDYVKVVTPAHYQVFYSRLGPYPRDLFESVVYRKPGFTEQWAHEASVVPVETWPLLRHRLDDIRFRPNGFDEFVTRHPAYADWVLDEIRSRGPLCADDLTVPEGIDRRLEGSWYGTIPRAILEAHFGKGNVVVVDRLPSLSRVFDLSARALGEEIVAMFPDPVLAERELLRQAARAYGIATAADLADYWRTRQTVVKPQIEALIESGELREVRVEGWKSPAYLHGDAVLPRAVDACTLVAPFDPLVWYRPRTERLFGFFYRLEIFTPRHRREYGAYVLPFVLGDSVVARVDLKREADCLRVGGAFLEPGADAERVAEALRAELRRLAGWLGTERVVVGRRGNLASLLS